MSVPQDLLFKVMEGGDISRQDALYLLNLAEEWEIQELCNLANLLTEKFHGRKPALCSITNAKSGLCPEDCSFCAQSIKYATGVNRYPLHQAEDILKDAQQAKANGSQEFCIVTSGRSISGREFCELVDAIGYIRDRLDIALHVSIGFLTRNQVRRLKQAGVEQINHNIQTSRKFFPKIVTTHTFEERLETLRAIREEDVKLCCGVIFGLGESREDRIDAAFELKKFHPECVPINLLDARPGTPLEKTQLLDPLEIIHTIAVWRFILPAAQIRLAGGRKRQLGSYQKEALTAGANGLIVGKLLTTPGSPLDDDWRYLKEAGFEIRKGSSHCDNGYH